MKTKVVFVMIIAILMQGCAKSWYLPDSDEIDVNKSGSYINIERKKGNNIKGELIAVYQSDLIVFPKDRSSCIVVPISDIEQFTLKYANSNHRYGSFIPFVLALPFVNGAFSIFTIPLHLIFTISVAATGENAFKYNNETINYNQLRMFARFPQGLPENIDMARIR